MAGRTRILWLSVLVIVAILILAASLHDVRFEPGLPLGQPAPLRVPAAAPAIQVLNEEPVWKIVLFWAACCVYLVLFLLVLPAQLRKRILRQLLTLAVGILLFVLALKFHLLQLPELFTNGGQQTTAGSAGPGAGPPIPPFRAPSIAPWIGFLITLILLWIVFALAWLLQRWWRSRNGLIHGPGGIESIARSALDDFASGRLWADIVIEAYSRMTEAVGSRRGLIRQHASTPREFADRLRQAGLPAESVSGLTRLFEAARYGGRSSGEDETREAVTYLESILRACGAIA